MCRPRPDGVIRFAGSTGPARSVRRRHVVAGLGFDGETRRLAESLKKGPQAQTRQQARHGQCGLSMPSLHAAPAGEGKPPPFISLRNLLDTPSRAPPLLSNHSQAITLFLRHYTSFFPPCGHAGDPFKLVTAARAPVPSWFRHLGSLLVCPTRRHISALPFERPWLSHPALIREAQSQIKVAPPTPFPAPLAGFVHQAYNPTIQCSVRPVVFIS